MDSQPTHYFDYAAATPLDPKIERAMRPFLHERFYNPSATYQAARNVRKELEAARDSVAMNIGVRSAGVHFTAGVTEANNLLITGLAARYPGRHFLLSAIEHESIVEPIARAQAVFNCSFDVVSVDGQGRLDTKYLAAKLKPETVCVSTLLVNNEIGTIQDLSKIADVLKQERTRRRQEGEKQPLVLHSDVAQAPAHIPVRFDRLKADALSISGAKIYGPKQTGALVLRPDLEITPLLVGGGQEKGLRGGTENVAGAVALATALHEAEALRESEATRLSRIQQIVETQLAEGIPGCTINAQKAKRTPHIVSVTIPGLDGERAVMELDERGYQVATGSACSAGSNDASHVIQALGRTPQEAAATLRISFGRQTTERAANELAQNVVELAAA